VKHLFDQNDSIKPLNKRRRKASWENLHQCHLSKWKNLCYKYSARKEEAKKWTTKDALKNH
jgi:hypothetical protein